MQKEKSNCDRSSASTGNSNSEQKKYAVKNDRIRFDRKKQLNALCARLENGKCSSRESDVATIGEEAIDSLKHVQEMNRKSIVGVEESYVISTTVNSEVETTVATLLPELEKSCTKMEKIYETLDAMEGLVLKLKFVVEKAKARANVLRKSCDEVDGPTLTSLLSSLLSTDVRDSDRNFPEWKTPLPEFRIDNFHPSCLRVLQQQGGAGKISGCADSSG